MIVTRSRILIACGLLLLTQQNIYAQGDVLPGAALPEQVSRALREERPRVTEPLPTITAPPRPAALPSAEAAKKITFQLNGINLVGNHVYSDEQLRSLFKDKIGKVISVAQLFEIVQAITNYYRNNGYILSRAILPPQHVKGGVVKIQIIEGFIDKVDVSGTACGARCMVLAFGERISACRPLEISRMERYLLLANEIPATSVRAVLAPSKTETGAADLTLVTENRPITGYLSYDNYGTRYIGPQQMSANVGFNSWIASGDSTNLTVTKTPKGAQLTYFDMNYSTPVNAEGWRWLLGGTKAVTRPGFVLKPVKIEGINLNYYTLVSIPVIRTRSKSLSFQGGFNYLDSFVTTLGEKLYTDHIRSLGIGMNFNFSDSILGGGANLIYLDVRQGLPIMGYTRDTNPDTAETSRPGGHAVYTKIDLNANRLQAIKGPFSLYLAFKGQYAFNALLAAEQFTFGGSQIGRGYDVAEIIGDKGVAATIEGRMDYPVNKFLLQSLQPYLFYDAGIIWNYDTSPTIVRKDSGTSFGFGTRFYFTKYVSGNLMWTQVLTKEIAALELIGRGRRPRVYFSIVASI